MSAHSEVPLGTTEDTVGCLQEGSFVVEDGLSLLESCNLSLTAGSALLVGLWLGNALILNLLQVLHDCSKLSLHAILVRGELSNCLVRGELSNCLVKASCLLGL